MKIARSITARITAAWPKKLALPPTHKDEIDPTESIHRSLVEAYEE